MRGSFVAGLGRRLALRAIPMVCVQNLTAAVGQVGLTH